MSERRRPVLIATKLNEWSDTVVRSGVQLARALDAPVWLLHTYKIPLLGDSQAAGSEGAFEAVEGGLRRSLDEQAERLGLAGEELAGVDLECGPLPHVLTARARELDALLVVMGGEADWGLGRRTERVLRHTGRPVFVVRTDAELPPKRVLAPVDLSALSADAFRCGLQLLEGIERGSRPEVEALFVLNPLERVGSMHFTPEQVDRFVAGEMRRFLERNGAETVHLGSQVQIGQAKTVILEAAETWQADLLLMGTHGRSGFERVVLGSVTEAMVRRAPCNVLVIPPDAALKSALSEERERRHHDKPAEEVTART
jgi:nucleotide-binding universal stress UspA family protein